MIDPTFVELSRWQFARDSALPFLFVPLTLRHLLAPGHHGDRPRDDGQEIYKDL